MPPKPTKKDRELVAAVLDHATQVMDGMAAPTMQKVLPLLKTAHDEIERDLKAWLKKQNGADRFTAQKMRNALVQVRAALAQAKQINPAMFQALAGNLKSIAGLSASAVETQLAAFGSTFEGAIAPISIDVAAVIADGQQSLFRRYKESAKRYAGSIGEGIERELAIGVMKNLTTDQLSTRLLKNLPHVFQGDRHRAERIVRTELAHTYNAFHKESVAQLAEEDEDTGFMERWDASFDLRRCPACASLEGKTIPIGGKFTAVWATGRGKKARMRSLTVEHPPLHPHCRCVLVAWHKDWPEGEFAASEREEDPTPIPSATPAEAGTEPAPIQEGLGAAQAAFQPPPPSEPPSAAQTPLRRFQLIPGSGMPATRTGPPPRLELVGRPPHPGLPAERHDPDQPPPRVSGPLSLQQLKAMHEKLHAETWGNVDPSKPEVFEAGLNKLEQLEQAITSAKASPPIQQVTPEATAKAIDYMASIEGDLSMNEAKAYWKDTYLSQLQVGATLTDQGNATHEQLVGMKQAIKQHHEATYGPEPKTPIPGYAPPGAPGHEWNTKLAESLKPVAGLAAKQQAKQVAKAQADHEAEKAAKKAKAVQANKDRAKARRERIKAEKLGPKPPSEQKSPSNRQSKVRIGLRAENIPTTQRDRHGVAVSSDADVVEGQNVAIRRVVGVDGAEYHEIELKITAHHEASLKQFLSDTPLNDQITSPTNEALEWDYRARSIKNGVLTDGADYPASKIYPGADVVKQSVRFEGAHVDVGTSGVVKNAVRFRIHGGPAEVERVMSSFGKKLGFEATTATDSVQQIKARLAYRLQPHEFSAKTTPEYAAGRFDKLKEANPWLKDVEQDAEMRHVFPNRVAPYSEALADRFTTKGGAQYLVHDTGSDPKVMVSVIKDGLVSTYGRGQRGLFPAPGTRVPAKEKQGEISPGADHTSGGAAGVFTRLKKTNSEIASHGRFRVIVDPKELGRLDAYAFNKDNYGAAGPNALGQRWSMFEMMQTKARSENEVIFPEGIQPNRFVRIQAKYDSDRDELLAELRKEGVTHVNGKPIEEFVVQGTRGPGAQGKYIVPPDDDDNEKDFPPEGGDDDEPMGGEDD